MTLRSEIELAIAGFAIGVAWSALRRPRPRPGSLPLAGVSILRPCEGAEPGLAERLRPPPSRLTAQVEVIACTSSLLDPAAVVARGVGARVASDREQTAGWSNPKVRHLEAGLSAARHPIIVLADADAHVGRRELDALLEALLKPGVAVSFAPPMAADRAAWGNRILRAALGGSLHAWPALLGLSRTLGQALPMSGALVAFHRDAIADDLAEAADSIGDDLQIAAILQRKGELVMSSVPVQCIHGDVSAREAIQILRRWVEVSTRHAPWRLVGFPLVFCATPALMLLATMGGLRPSSLALWAAVAARFAAAATIRWRLVGGRPRFTDMLLTEIVLLDAAARAGWAMLTGKELRWRHRSYRITTGGRITSVRERSV